MIIREIGYFRGVQQILRSSTKRDIANYVGWRILQSYSPFLPKSDRLLFHQYKANLTNNKEEDETKRWETCLSLSMSLLDVPIGRLFVESFYANEFAQSKVTSPLLHFLTIRLYNVFICF